jgi:hypothetical protein
MKNAFFWDMAQTAFFVFQLGCQFDSKSHYRTKHSFLNPFFRLSAKEKKRIAR